MKFQSVLTLAPLRISFLGGGTDIRGFYSSNTGKVISAAINKYVYVHIKRHDPLFQERYRISYSQIEYADSRSQIQNGIVRSCLELLNIDEPLQISTSADLPANSGLGSSSSFATALLLGLHELMGQSVSANQLAEEASFVEIEMLEEPIGKQDQYSAAFGGMNFYEFYGDESVKIQPITMSSAFTSHFFDNSMIIWTGESRSASMVLSEQKQKQESNKNQLIELTYLVDQFKAIMSEEELDLVAAGSLIKSGWQLKQTFSMLINTSQSQRIMDLLEQNGALGYKLLGAGGGGFVYSLFDRPSSSFKNEFREWKTFIPSLDNTGARIASVI